ncbi:MAG: rubrerythrin family protein [Bradyrhizobium sp.]
MPTGASVFPSKLRRAHAFSQGNRDRAESEGRVRWREPGEPPLSLFRAEGRRRGFNDVAAVFRSTAEGETGHAHGHLKYLQEVDSAATCKPIGPTGDNLNAAIASETHEYTDVYPAMARVARRKGFDEIADWFETLAKAGKSHAGRFQKALDENWNVIGGKHGRKD